jgi:hypothetical protein
VEYNLSFMGTKFLATKKKIFNLVKYIKGLIIKIGYSQCCLR